jgi:hypothetical protein
VTGRSSPWICVRAFGLRTQLEIAEGGRKLVATGNPGLAALHALDVHRIPEEAHAGSAWLRAHDGRSGADGTDRSAEIERTLAHGHLRQNRHRDRRCVRHWPWHRTRTVIGHYVRVQTGIRKLTRDSKLGRPQDFTLDMGTSPILIQHAFHLLHYEDCTKTPFLDCDMIFEVGGGYGSFCRLLEAAGFGGCI